MGTRIALTTADGSKGSLTSEGATVADAGPAGAVLRMLAAVIKGDEAGWKREMVPSKVAQGTPTPPGKDVTVTFGPVANDGGDMAVVPTEILSDGQRQPVAFVTVRDGAAWKVDMDRTLERMMAPMMEAMTEGMQAMGDALGTAMQGVGDALAGALGGAPAGKKAKSGKPAAAKRRGTR